MPGPKRRPISAKNAQRPEKPRSGKFKPKSGESKPTGRVIGLEDDGSRAASGAKPRRPAKFRPAKAPSSRYSGKPRPGGKLRVGGKPRPGIKRRRPPVAVPSGEHPEGERLQKVLAAAGFGSRRQCEELIASGRVEVDRKVVMQLGTRIRAGDHEIRVDGETLSLGKRVYYAVNKPKGVVTTNRDPAGRPRVIDLVPKDSVRLFPIGRLDLYSEGLILVTNDGELANRLTHPRYGVKKIYLAQVAGQPTPEVLDKLRRGVHLAEGVARVDEIRVESTYKDSTWLEITLSEGMNREIRRLLARVGHKVLRLVRIQVGPVRLGKLPPGATRLLTREEVDALQASQDRASCSN